MLILNIACVNFKVRVTERVETKGKLVGQICFSFLSFYSPDF